MRLIVLLCVTFLLLGVSAPLAQAWTPEERYYAGIGAEFWTVDKSTLGFYLGDAAYNNQNGAFTGKTIVNSLLNGAPAKLAGLRAGDIVLSVDGTPIETLAGGIDEYVRRHKAGEKITLAVARPDTEGKVVLRQNFEITLERIDRVAWLPIGRTLSGGIGGDAVSLSYSYLVTEDAAAGEFVYHYTLVNESDQRIMVHWKVLGRLATGWFGATTILILEPRETMTIKTRSADLPGWLSSSVDEGLEVLIWNKGDNLREHAGQKANAVRLSRGGYWSMWMATRTYVLVPAYAAR